MDGGVTLTALTGFDEQNPIAVVGNTVAGKILKNED